MPFFSHLCPNPASKTRSSRGTSQHGTENINKTYEEPLLRASAPTEVTPAWESQSPGPRNEGGIAGTCIPREMRTVLLVHAVERNRTLTYTDSLSKILPAAHVPWPWRRGLRAGPASALGEAQPARAPAFSV